MSSLFLTNRKSKRKIKSAQPTYTRKFKTSPRKPGSVSKTGKYLTKRIRRTMETAMNEYKGKNISIKDVCSGKGSNFDTEISKYNLIKKIGEGTYGKVYIADEKNKNSEIVIKVQKLLKYENIDEFYKEANLTKKLYYDYQIGPRFLNAWYCMENKFGGPATGYIVAEKMDGDLESLMNNDDFTFKKNVYLSKKAYSDFKRKLKVLHQNGYVHADLMPKNVLVKTKQIRNRTVITKMIMTDFGLSDKKENLKKDRSWLMTLFDYTKKSYPDTMTTSFNDIKANPILLDNQFLLFIDKKLPIH